MRRLRSSSKTSSVGEPARAPGQFLIAGAKAFAAMDGRPAISIEDVRKVAIPVLRHRVSTNFQAQAEGVTSETVIQRLIAEIPEPKIAKYE